MSLLLCGLIWFGAYLVIVPLPLAVAVCVDPIDVWRSGVDELFAWLTTTADGPSPATTSR